MTTCDITGLKAHWRVTMDSGETKHFNSVRCMVDFLQTKNCDISTHNFYNIQREIAQGRNIPHRLSRFRNVKQIEQLTKRQFILPQ